MMTAQDEAFELAVTLRVKIRKLKQADLRLLEWYGQFKHYRRLFLKSYRGQLEGSRLMLVANINDFPIGRLFIQFHGQNTRISDGKNRAYLYSFSVLDIFQGQGIGTRLIQSAEIILRDRDYEMATIAVVKENEGALRLYQGQGYRIFGEEEGRWRYYDHRNILRHVHEPCWLLEKVLFGTTDRFR
jgi:GNAT superfamily N-acetyltransferase